MTNDYQVVSLWDLHDYTILPNDYQVVSLWDGRDLEGVGPVGPGDAAGVLQHNQALGFAVSVVLKKTSSELNN